MKRLSALAGRGTMSTTGPDASQYDHICDRYIQDVERDDSWNNLYERPFMLRLIADQSPECVLDLGVATGFYSHYFCLRGASVIAVDKSESMLAHVRKRAGERVAVVRADLERGLGFVDTASQNLVMASLVLHYLADWSELVSDIHRVLVPGGRFLISMHHPFSDFLAGKRTDYHRTVLVDDVWGPEDGRYPVRYYSRSLQEVFSQLLGRGLRLARVLEPAIPDGEQGTRLGIVDADRLKPGLLFLELIKD